MISLLFHWEHRLLVELICEPGVRPGAAGGWSLSLYHFRRRLGCAGTDATAIRGGELQYGLQPKPPGALSASERLEAREEQT